MYMYIFHITKTDSELLLWFGLWLGERGGAPPFSPLGETLLPALKNLKVEEPISTTTIGATCI